jgi:hypothetical protein
MLVSIFLFRPKEFSSALLVRQFESASVSWLTILVDYLGFSLYKTMLSVNKDSLTASFPLVSFSCPVVPKEYFCLFEEAY